MDEDRICTECGSDTWFAQNFEQYRDELHSVRKEYQGQAVKHAAEKANWQLDEFGRQERHHALERKTVRQRKEINRLTEKLRALNVKPYGNEEAR